MLTLDCRLQKHFFLNPASKRKKKRYLPEVGPLSKFDILTEILKYLQAIVLKAARQVGMLGYLFLRTMFNFVKLS